MNIQRCKGTRDLTPQDMRRFHIIEKAFRTSCQQWGYDEIKTPVLEYLHLFTSAGTLTPTMLSKVYSFLDWDGWSGERVVLRPDVTIPVARFYIENMAKQATARLFYVANIFSFEETGEKSRERWQCGAEFIGTASFAADVELIMLSLEVLDKMGLKNAELHLSHAGIIKGLLKKLELSSDEQQQIFDRILDGDEKALETVKSRKPELEGVFTFLLNLKGKSSSFIKNFRSLSTQSFPELQPEVDNFINIVDLLQDSGYKFRIDFTSVRGFEYYTGVIFQLFNNGEKIGGGGRYDDLISSMGAKATPASGFALYLDRIMGLVSLPDTIESPAGKIMVITEDDNKQTVSLTFNALRRLRQDGFNAEMQFGKIDTKLSGKNIRITVDPPQFTLSDPAASTDKPMRFDSLDAILTYLKQNQSPKGQRKSG